MSLSFPDKNSLDCSKQREYLKQQHQLRTMSKTSTALSADDMIENLLSKKEIFQKKKDNNQQQKHSSKMDPLWLTEGNEPAVYRRIWEQVCTPSGLTDTPTLSYILLGSGLGTDTLGYIWSLTNTTVSGALTKIELFRNLALVALAQKGYSFTNLLVLNQFSEAPIPRLDLRPSVQVMPSSNAPAQMAGQSLTSIPPFVQVPTVTETLSLLDTLTEPLVPMPVNSTAQTSSFSVLSATDLNRLTVSSDHKPSSSSNIDDDEFDDFKSADIFSTANSLTVLDIKDNSSNVTEAVITEDLFKTNIPSFTFPSDKRNALDDIISASTEEDSDKKTCDDNKQTNSTSKKDDAAVVTSSLQEALREDLTLAPVSLSCMVTSIPSTAPVDSDRYNALRQLAATDYGSSQEDLYDDFGDFIAATQPSSDTTTNSLTMPNAAQSSLLQSDLQEKCLEACVHVLREANDLFKSIDDTKVLAEVIGDDRGKRYLEEIVEVERIGRRIISSRSAHTDDCELSKQIESLCKALQPFTKPLEHTHMEEEKGAKCELCQCEQGPAHVKYGINQFHAPCANLFLHVTGELLPLTPVT